MKYLILLLALSGCNSFGSNITDSKSLETKGSDKVGAAFEESRTVEAPQPSNVHVQASGNASVIIAPQEEPPVKRDTIETGRTLKSSERVSALASELFEQHSSMFYLITAIAALLFVAALKWFGTTCVGRGLARGVDLADDVVGGLKSRMVNADSGTQEYRILNELHNEAQDLRRKLEKR